MLFYGEEALPIKCGFGLHVWRKVWAAADKHCMLGRSEQQEEKRILTLQTWRKETLFTLHQRIKRKKKIK